MSLNNLRKLREKKGWTQEELSVRLNVTDRTIRKWEAGENISPKKLRQICDLFEVTEEEFFSVPTYEVAKEQEEPPPPPPKPFYLHPPVIIGLVILLIIAAGASFFVLYRKPIPPPPPILSPTPTVM